MTETGTGRQISGKTGKGARWQKKVQEETFGSYSGAMCLRISYYFFYL